MLRPVVRDKTFALIGNNKRKSERERPVYRLLHISCLAGRVTVAGQTCWASIARDGSTAIKVAPAFGLGKGEAARFKTSLRTFERSVSRREGGYESFDIETFGDPPHVAAATAHERARIATSEPEIGKEIRLLYPI